MCMDRNTYDLIVALAVLGVFCWVWWVMFNAGD